MSKISIQFQDSVSISSEQSGESGTTVRGQCCERSHHYHLSHSLVHRGFLPSRVTQCGGREEREGDGEEDGDRRTDVCATSKLDNNRYMWRFVCSSLTLTTLHVVDCCIVPVSSLLCTKFY